MKQAITPQELLCQLLAPRPARRYADVHEVRRLFAPPATMGNPEHPDLAFDDAGGYDALFQSLSEHSAELGQLPASGFLGYGMLQQIAQNGMIRAAIQTIVDDMTAKWIKVRGGDNSDKEAVQALEDAAENRYHLRSTFHEAFLTTGFMGGALIFIDTGAEGKELELPLAFNSQSSELTPETPLRFTVIDPVNVSPADYNADNPLRGDYMQARSWFVMGQRVHASRLLRIVDNEPPILLKPNYNFLGIPQAQILWDYVLHFNDCRVYTANLLRKISLLVFKTDMTAILESPNGISSLDAKMAALARYRDNDSVMAVDMESEDITNVQTAISGCTDIVRQCLEMICSIDRVPAVKLLGISPAGFNATGESDLKNYYDHIHSKQELHRDAIQTCLKAIQLVDFGRLDQSTSFDFIPLNPEDEAAKATAASTRITALTQLIDRQAISAEELRQAAKQDKNLGLDFINDELPEAPAEQEEFVTGQQLDIPYVPAMAPLEQKNDPEV